MTHVGDKCLAIPDGKGGYIIRGLGPVNVGDRVLAIPDGGGGYLIVNAGAPQVGMKAIIKTVRGQSLVIVGEGVETEPGPEGEPPGSFYLVSHDPLNGATGVARDKTMTAVFIDDVYPPSVLDPVGDDTVYLLDEHTVKVAGFPGVAGKTVTFDPVFNLNSNEPYTMVYGHYIRNTDQKLLYKQYNRLFTTELSNPWIKAYVCGNSYLSKINVETQTLISNTVINNIMTGAIIPDGKKAYLTVDIYVYIYNTETDVLIKQLNTGYATLMGLAAHPTNHYVYVCSRGSNKIVIIDTITDTVTGTIAITAPNFICFKPDGTKAYVSSYNTSLPGWVKEIDIATQTISKTINITQDSYLFSIDYNPANGHVLVNSNYRLYDVNIAAGTYTFITLTQQIRSLGVTNNGTKYYITTWDGWTPGAGALRVYDCLTNNLLNTYPGAEMEGLAIAPDDSYVYYTERNPVNYFYLRIRNVSTGILVKTISGVNSPGCVTTGANSKWAGIP